MDAEDDYGATPLHAAIDLEPLVLAVALRATVALLLESGDNPHAFGYDGFTALRHAAFWGDPEIVERLILAGVNVYAQHKDGQAALHMAVGGHDRNIVERLLAHPRTDSTFKDHCGRTPRSLAMAMGLDLIAAAVRRGWKASWFNLVFHCDSSPGGMAVL